MDNIVKNASELLTQLSQVQPMGPVEQIQDKTFSELGITPPSQVDSQKMVTMQVPFRVHERVGKWLDKVLGPSIPIKLGGVPTGEFRRPGERKYIKNITDVHNRRMKKVFKKIDFDDSKLYIFALIHDDLYAEMHKSKIVTCQTIGRGVNGLQMIIERDLQPLIDQYKIVFEEMMQQKYIEETSVSIIIEHRNRVE